MKNSCSIRDNSCLKLHHVNFIHVDRRGLHGLASLLGVPLSDHHRALHLIDVLRVVLGAIDCPFPRNLTKEGINAISQLEHYRVNHFLVACLAIHVLAGLQPALIQNSN